MDLHRFYNLPSTNWRTKKAGDTIQPEAWGGDWGNSVNMALSPKVRKQGATVFTA
jgi:hypothetical protein